MTAAAALPEADLSAVRSKIVELRKKNYPRGVVAIAAVPAWSGPETFEQDGQTVRVRTAPSVLAVRDALTERHRDGIDWVVILTDCEAAELPVGVLEHLVAGRLSNLDPWPALRELFRASRQEFHLLSLNNDAARAALRDLDEVDKPAPRGVLTNDHLFAELSRQKFGLRPAEYTPHHVALWSMDAAATARFDVWRQDTDPALLEQFYAWIADRLGTLGPIFVTVWRAGGPADLVPLGLVAALLGDSNASFPAPRDTMIKVRTLLEVELSGSTLTEQQLTAWGNAAALAVTGTDVPDGVLRRAEDAVRRLQAEPLVARSDVLPMSLAPRIAHFAAALSDAVDSGNLAAAENAWADVVAHRAAHDGTPDAPRDVRVGAAALRLLRRRGLDWPAPGGLTDWLAYYRQDLSWVDDAVNDAFVGADDRRLAEVAHRIVTAVRAARGKADRAFAEQLRSEGVHRPTSGDLLVVEDVLDRIVKPLTVPPSGPSGGLGGLGGITPGAPKPSPVLLVIADGMSAAVSNEVVADALRRHRPQWQECRLAGTERPHAALAALPTVTRFSRCSLLTGALAEGGQDKERAGFANWLQHNGFKAAGPVLFHKAEMDLVTKTHSLADVVRDAVGDIDGRPVVACVLNDIDDALDRSDPIGTAWRTSSFKHLDPLLTAAAAVGRTVVLVSDHGHVVERREQSGVQRGQQISARYRTNSAEAHDDEVLVAGERVLTANQRAVLAVDEQVRYTGLRAGYHGGAAPAEAVIPVTILVNGAVPRHLELEVVPPPQPAWWQGARPAPEPVQAERKPAPRPKPAAPAKTAAPADALFDLGTPAEPVEPLPAGRDRIAELLASELFKQQYQQFKPKFQKPVIGALLQELIDNNNRLPFGRAADILGVKATRARAAVAILAQVLNTDGVVVLSDNGSEVELESALMFEQYGVAP